MWTTLQRFPHKPWIRIGIAFGSCALLGWACGPADDLRGVVRLNLGSRLTSIDPAQATSQSNCWISSQIFEGLVGLDEHLKIVPRLAKDWTIEDSGRVYRFRLRKGVRFQGDSAGRVGPPLRSADVRLTFRRLLGPDTRSAAPAYFTPHLLGAEAFRTGASDSLPGLETPDDSTVIFRLIEPYSPFLQVLALPLAAIVSENELAVEKPDPRRGTGPYRLMWWADDRRLVLQRNENYWSALDSAPQIVDVRFLRDRLIAFTELKLGRLDFIEGIDPAQTQEVLDSSKLMNQSDLRLYLGPQLTTEYLGFNTGEHPFDQRDIRLALRLSINRRQLCTELLQQLADPAEYSLIPPALRATDSTEAPAYDLRKARQLLAAAGFPNGAGLPELKLWTTAAHRSTAQFIQFAWQQLGLRVRIEVLEGAALREAIYQGQAQCWRASWIADYADAENYHSLFWSRNLAPDGPNTTRFQDPIFDRLFEQYRRLPPGPQQARLGQQLDSLLAAQSPALPLYYYKTVRLIGPRIASMPHSPMNLWFRIDRIRLREV